MNLTAQQKDIRADRRMSAMLGGGLIVIALVWLAGCCAMIAFLHFTAGPGDGHDRLFITLGVVAALPSPLVLIAGCMLVREAGRKPKAPVSF